MVQINQAGQLNTAALTVPNLYLQIQPPGTLALNGASSGRIGQIGVASWGPVDQPIAVGSMGDYVAAFGPKTASVNDMGVAVNVALLQGASDFRCVRVTDGTDTAAFAGLASYVVAYARYTGTQGNAITVSVSMPANGGVFSVIVSHPSLGNAIYTGTTWQAIANAMAADPNGLMVLSGTGVASTAPPTEPFSKVATGGANGGTPATAAFVGAPAMISASGTGMYALAAQSCALGVLVGVTDPASWSAQTAFGLSNGVYMVTSGPSGDTIANASATLASSGASSYALKVMFGDWLWWNDDTNGLMLLPSSVFAAGILAGLSPQNASLNKQLYGVVGSQKSGQVASGGGLTYSSAELSALFGAGIDVICNPAPGGAYWACRSGHNSAGTTSTFSDSYTRMTNFLAETFAGGMGTYIGATINDTLFNDIRSTMLAFLSGLLQQGILGTVGGALPYAVKCDATNNPQARIALGYVQCDVQVQYQGINEKFIVNLQGGSSVSVTTTGNS